MGDSASEAALMRRAMLASQFSFWWAVHPRVAPQVGWAVQIMCAVQFGWAVHVRLTALVGQATQQSTVRRKVDYRYAEPVGGHHN